jgi:hypothetical protein
MNKTRALIACSLAAAVPLVAAAPGSGQQGQGRVTIAANPATVIFGNTTAISGEARGGGGDNAPVRLQQDPFPFEGAYSDVASGTTDATGRFTFRVGPRLNTRYRAVVANRESDELLVPVRIRVTRSVSDATPRRGQLVRFSGTAAPAHDGAIVRIERKRRDGTYGLVARTVLRDAGDERSRYSRRIRVRSTGTYRVVVVSNDGDHVNGTSRPRRLRVHG